MSDTPLLGEAASLLALGDTALLAAVERLGVHRALLFQTLGPVAATALAVAFLGEAIRADRIAGIALAFGQGAGEPAADRSSNLSRHLRRHPADDGGGGVRAGLGRRRPAGHVADLQSLRRAPRRGATDHRPCVPGHDGRRLRGEPLDPGRSLTSTVDIDYR